MASRCDSATGCRPYAHAIVWKVFRMGDDWVARNAVFDEWVRTIKPKARDVTAVARHFSPDELLAGLQTGTAPPAVIPLPHWTNRDAWSADGDRQRILEEFGFRRAAKRQRQTTLEEWGFVPK